MGRAKRTRFSREKKNQNDLYNRNGTRQNYKTETRVRAVRRICIYLALDRTEKKNTEGKNTKKTWRKKEDPGKRSSGVEIQPPEESHAHPHIYSLEVLITFPTHTR